MIRKVHSARDETVTDSSARDAIAKAGEPAQEDMLFEEARLAMRSARDATAALVREQIIADPPAEGRAER